MPATTLTESELDILLVRQKDHVLKSLNHDPIGTMRQLEVVAELWRELGYEYKTREILARMVTNVDETLARLYARR